MSLLIRSDFFNIQEVLVHPHTVETRFEAVTQYLSVRQALNGCTSFEAEMSCVLWRELGYPFGLRQQRAHLLLESV